MRSVGLEALKDHLREYVRVAAGGETVLVTDRDRVVAQLVQAGQIANPLSADALLATAVGMGWLTPASCPSQSPPPRIPIASWNELEAELELDRTDR